MTANTPTFERTEDAIVVGTDDGRYTFSAATGTPRRVEERRSGAVWTLEAETSPIEWTVGGTERRDPPAADTVYENATTHGAELSLVDVEFDREGSSTQLHTIGTCGDWRLRNTYSFEGGPAGLEWAADLAYTGSAEEVRVRSVRIPFRIPIRAPSDTDIDVPAAPIPPAVSIGELDPGPLLEWGLRRYHAGLLGLDAPRGGMSVWAFSKTFPTSAVFEYEPGDQALSVEYEFHAADRLSPGEHLSISSLGIGVFEQEWVEWLDTFEEWWETIGIRTPDERPGWFDATAIFEAHVGAAQFPADFEYEPYPTMGDLVADLPRIARLGFETLQLMPRHPYPSYSVLHPEDSLTPWGEPAELRRLTGVAHALGLNVVLDVVMHGVLDTDVLDRTLESIDERDGDPFDDPLSAYVLSHAPSWRPHLPERNPLLQRQPEWFVRTDSGSIAHRYTHAFDLANPAVQEFLVETLESVVETYDVDGFRIDAPTWNAFPNWDDELPYPAGHSPFGTVELLEDARERLRAINEDIALYVEAASPVFRTASDANYSYDELWLFEAVFGAERTRLGRKLDDEVTGREIAQWLDRREKALPEGARTAHQLDSHDTFWWLDPGQKWFRERYGRERTEAVLSLVALLPGPFMNYVGGETDIEEHLGRLLEIRAGHEELQRGDCRYAVGNLDPAVVTVVRSLGDKHTLVAVNLADEPLTTSLAAGTILDSPEYVVVDALDLTVVAEEVDPESKIEVDFDAFQPRVLVFRRRTSRK